MKKDKTEDIIDRAIVRKGEQEALCALEHIESGEQLRQIMHAAEHRHRSLWLRRSVWGLTSAAAVIAVILTIGLQPRYSTDELYIGWRDAVVYESTVSRGEDPAQEEYQSALALAQEGSSTEAIAKFRLIVSDSSSQYAPDAMWQLALLYLKTSQRTDAKQMLHTIIDQQGEYSDKAKELLDKIEQRRWF